MIIKKNDDRNLLPTDVIGSSVARSKRWLVAIVRICHEKKTGERLTKMGIENFLPIQQEVHQWSDRRKIVDRVLLPMMIFVHVDLQEQKEVLTLSSISRYMVLRGESTPAVIPDQQMLRFKFMLDYSDETISMHISGLSGCPARQDVFPPAFSPPPPVCALPPVHCWRASKGGRLWLSHSDGPP